MKQEILPPGDRFKHRERSCRRPLLPCSSRPPSRAIRSLGTLASPTTRWHNAPCKPGETASQWQLENPSPNDLQAPSDQQARPLTAPKTSSLKTRGDRVTGPAGRALPAATAQSRDSSVLLFLFHQNGCGSVQPRPPEPRSQRPSLLARTRSRASGLDRLKDSVARAPGFASGASGMGGGGARAGRGRSVVLVRRVASLWRSWSNWWAVCQRVHCRMPRIRADEQAVLVCPALGRFLGSRNVKANQYSFCDQLQSWSP